jgi:HPt (histidine-containing phosphotransfer) domain-containing protein
MRGLVKINHDQRKAAGIAPRFRWIRIFAAQDRHCLVSNNRTNAMSAAALSAFPISSNPAAGAEPETRHPGDGPSSSRPIDLVHLAHQTMGDKDLEVEILALFARQARVTLAEMTAGDIPAATVAHRIKGAANAVGAFQVAAAAGLIEAGHTDAASLARFGASVIEAENFINRLRR